ncbi:MAG TPA: hypothetical protein VJX28_03450 [Chthoniobacterales bacterium]|nr:hypothetical protein [Chthoniobacterales bacterium]
MQQLPWSVANSSHQALPWAMSLAVRFSIGMFLESVPISSDEKREGNDAPGLGFRITSAIADSGVNLRGISGAVVGRKFVVYLGFDGNADADKAAHALKDLASTKKSGSAKRA